MKKLIFIAVIFVTFLTVGSANGTSPDLNKYTAEQIQKLSSAPGKSSDEGVISVDPKTVLRDIPVSPTDRCWRAPGIFHSWGTYPFHQVVYEDRTWCADYLGGPQNYRTSHISLDSLLCSNDSAGAYRVSGGNGYTWTTMHNMGDFHCPTPIPWVTYNYHRWVEKACNTWGSCSEVDHS